MNVKKEVRIKPKVDSYVTGRAASGASVKINGDTVSAALNGLSLEQTVTITVKLTGDNTYNTKYAHLNKGHQRMCLGNVLRGFVNKSEENMQKFTSATAPLIAKAKAERDAADKAKAEAKAKAERDAADKAEAKAKAEKAKAEAEAKIEAAKAVDRAEPKRGPIPKHA
jgi:uncharacterized membrane protein YqiK